LGLLQYFFSDMLQCRNSNLKSNKLVNTLLSTQFYQIHVCSQTSALPAVRIRMRPQIMYDYASDIHFR
jgi:hypothetical protein